LFLQAIFSSFLILIFIYDFRFGSILDRFIIPGIIFAVIGNLVTESVSLRSMFFGALACGGFFLFQYIVSRGKWTGLGDVMAGVMIGAMLGLVMGIQAVFLAYIIGAIFAVFFLACKKGTLKSEIPFGTFLAFGAYVVMLWGKL
jgi:prepilin signal peptidase PulO-like enzyme (type II secretory pathway)